MSYASVASAYSPLAGWLLDETFGAGAADFSGNSRPLSVIGGVTLGATTVMPTGTAAFDFPGVNTAYLNLVGASWMAVPSFTITAWIQMDSTSSYKCVWSRDTNGAGVRGPSLYVTSGKLNLFAGSDNLGTATLSTGTNYFVAATYDSATSTLVYYVDAAVDATLTSVSMPNSGGYDMVVGASYAASPTLSFPFDGRIGPVAYFPSALSPTQVADLYAAGTTASPDATVTPPAASAMSAAVAPVVSASRVVLPPAATATAAAVAPMVNAGGNVTITPPAATATATALAPTITQVIPAGTDTSNSLNGRRRRARASVVVTRPAAATPSRAAVKYDKSVPYPPPTLVNGRPT